MTENKIKLAAIVGPTAGGKSALALEIAGRLPVEIICMDSMQVYRHMDIGTAKPTPQEQKLCPHHMLDVVEPSENYSVAAWKEAAEAKVSEVRMRGRIPLLVGGTGLYLSALTLPMTLGETSHDEKLREALLAEASTEAGRLSLHKRLAEIDSISAAKFHPNDFRRVIRALEVYIVTGKPVSAQAALPENSKYDALILGVSRKREKLYERINQRVDGMMKDGLLGEVEGLVRRGISPECTSMQGLGYKELYPVVTKGLPLADAVYSVKLGTRRYAKRQMTWFRRDGRVSWLDEKDGFSCEDKLRHFFGL
ncbi:MAG: tRNA (adenosine(37)-N6)-dimethylallyltransferase MiaA [Eubacteriales bacterium]|nr:tRNA (adenosine(37)-N6)-dimethylallyltransferase MiaA [Eubacteriales bacterium]MDD3882800.1 tRNA (adenosine(37)-N6)-dimethylallyltransferase MiaA [Eubacteriales bacterium]MDD4513302.1 tRNA (adenosine(37)-N6)-dimethylallyltransferase MiaA [Eubacteriales bacterium]